MPRDGAGPASGSEVRREGAWPPERRAWPPGKGGVSWREGAWLHSIPLRQQVFFGHREVHFLISQL